MTRILIVDDKEENLYYLRTVLTGNGYTVEPASHGAEALVKARQNPPDLIVSDLLMPVMDGYTLLRHWKADERLRKIPFIVYTATYTEEEDERLALSLGADAFILKPAEPDDFLARIREVLANAAASVPTPPKHPVGDENELLKVYSETLIRKLEEKTLQLEEANRMLKADITERKAAEEALRASEARFRRLVDSNAQGVMFWNTKGEITGANDAFLRIVGYTRGDLEAGIVNWEAVTPPEYADLDRSALAEIMAAGVCAPYEKEYLRKDGSRVPVFVAAATFEDTPGEGFCFVLDIAERKKLEQQFLRAQRMESIGTLAGGIAHDLNNVLSPIMMALEVMKMRFPDAESQDLLSILSSSAQRGADMVRQVLSFARGVEGRRMEVQVKHLIQDIEKITNDTFLKNIQVKTIIPNGLWTVIGDPTQLHQVLLNLCVNARDAMPSGGKLTISAQNLSLDAHYAGMNPDAKPGPYVLLQVEDSGTGMPAEVIEKIFDPFFTTKEIGKGTGLGLSTSLAIVQSHGGFLRVYSEPGKGTTFKVHLPARTETSAGVAAKIAADLPRGNGELILVVDDEAAVRQITQQTLEAFGYRVILASDGTEAVAIYAPRKTEIAAVLTDMMMPAMDGITAVQIIRKLNPAVRIIAASGLAANSQIASLGVKHFLAKPYTAETLLKAMKEVLSAT
jgi:PAS domain S-box-containing protein